MAPEYAMRGRLSYKTDVYGFGVVTLEIVSGKTNVGDKLSEEGSYLPDRVIRFVLTLKILLSSSTLLIMVAFLRHFFFKTEGTF